MTLPKAEYRKVSSVGQQYRNHNKTIAYSLCVVIPQEHAKLLGLGKGSLVKFSLSRSKIPYLKMEKCEVIE